MNILLKLLTVMIYLTPIWCSPSRTKRTAVAQHPPTEIDYFNVRYPELLNMLPTLCKEHNNQVPWLRRRQERVFAVNEQLIPQPYMYQNQNQYRPYKPQGIYYPDDSLSNQSQFPTQGYNTINALNQDRQFPQNMNDIMSNNQQFINVQNEQPFANQIQRPPLYTGGLSTPSQLYPNNYYPSQIYTPPMNYQHINEQGGTNKIKIAVNTDGNNKLHGNTRGLHRMIRPYQGSLQTGNNLPQYPEQYSYNPTQQVQDNTYSGSSIYPRSVQYVENDFPKDLMYSGSFIDPAVSYPYRTPDLLPAYVIDSRGLDSYIQTRIDAKTESLNAKTNGTENSNSKNQTTT